MLESFLNIFYFLNSGSTNTIKFSDGNFKEMSFYNLSSETLILYGTVELNILRTNLSVKVQYYFLNPLNSNIYIYIYDLVITFDGGYYFTNYSISCYVILSNCIIETSNYFLSSSTISISNVKCMCCTSQSGGFMTVENATLNNFFLTYTLYRYYSGYLFRIDYNSNMNLSNSRISSKGCSIVFYIVGGNSSSKSPLITIQNVSFTDISVGYSCFYIPLGYIRSSSLLSNCLFRNISSLNYGGVFYQNSSTSFTIQNCIFLLCMGNYYVFFFFFFNVFYRV
jgi:hypothetical protein